MIDIIKYNFQRNLPLGVADSGNRGPSYGLARVAARTGRPSTYINRESPAVSIIF